MALLHSNKLQMGKRCAKEEEIIVNTGLKSMKPAQSIKCGLTLLLYNWTTVLYNITSRWSKSMDEIT